MFNKRKPNWNLAKELTTIRDLILQQDSSIAATGYAALYITIYTNAKIGMPAACNYNQGSGCTYPAWVKDNAIVHLLGITYKREGGVEKFTYTPNPIHPSESRSFSDRANDGLRNLNPKIVSCWGGEDCDVLKDKAFDLIYYLQAYDLLKASGYYAEGDGDRNNGNCHARNKLREFTRNFYDESNRVINSNSGWKKESWNYLCKCTWCGVYSTQ